MARSKDTEVDAYIFIKENLKTLGWNTKNPNRNVNGEVFTQNECLHNDEIKEVLGQQKPENIVKIGERNLWIIEAKRSHLELDKALGESLNYARYFKKSKNLTVSFVSGVAGNDGDGYLIKTMFLKDDELEEIKINNKEISSLLPKEIALQIISTQNPLIEDLPIDENLFLTKAEKINAILHLGAINKNYRAKIMAALLLSLVEETTPNLDSPPSVLIDEINSRVRRALRKARKSEFYDFIKISLPPTEDNHTKFKTALVSTIQELNNLNIRSAMNSGHDVLGKFYEVFLKYGNGAKEIGIVLTPRHVTNWAVDLLKIDRSDYVYDPTCGTGGFLVAAFDHVKSNSNENEVETFKKYHLFGIEQEPEVVALAIVNMIFRGDGKNNIIVGDCFKQSINEKTINGKNTGTFSKKEGHKIINKVLMNPPFALKSSDEKEYKFVQKALDQMDDGGMLFSVLPSSVMFESGEELIWRREKLLKENTLLSVITFPPELFYPIGVHSLGIFVLKGIPHNPEKDVFWARFIRDGFLKIKGKRLPNKKEQDDFKKLTPLLYNFVYNDSQSSLNVPEVCKTCPIDYCDEYLELVPEVYLDNKDLNQNDIESYVDSLMRESIVYMIRNKEKLDEIS